MKLAQIIISKIEEKTFKNKQEFIEFIKHQTNIELQNDGNSSLNRKRNILYTKIDYTSGYQIIPILKKLNIRHEEHMDGYYWIWIK